MINEDDLDVHLQREVNDATAASNRRINELRRKLAEFEVDVQREQRLLSGHCRYCFYLRTPTVVMHAVTEKPCFVCATIVRYGNSHTLKYCGPCAIKHHLCRECGGDLSMAKREHIQQPRRLAEREEWWKAQDAAMTKRRQAYMDATEEIRKSKLVGE